RYVAVGGGKWAKIEQSFRDRLGALDDVVQRSRSGLEISAAAAPLLEDLVRDDGALQASKTWALVVHRLDAAQTVHVEPPPTLTADLRDYQRDGFAWLKRLSTWGVGGILADDMGLGKTPQTLAVLIDRRELGPALVVAPTSVGFNWQRETERFAPTLRTLVYRDLDRDQTIQGAGPGDVVIVSYGLLQRDEDKFAGRKWGTIVFDEAQALKNAQTKTAHAARRLDSDWRIALTGTPVENHLGELWSIFRVVSPGLFGSWERFRDRFADAIEKQRDLSRRKALARVIRPFVLRRTKAEVLSELPPRTEIRLTAELSTEERRRYEESRLAALARLSGTLAEPGKDRRFEVLAAMTRLRQLSCHPRLVDEGWIGGSAKLDLFLNLVDELREGRHRALVFSQFTTLLGVVREALDQRKVRYQYLDGQTPARERQVRVDAFQRGEGDLFLISLRAGGTGLNLTAADYVVHLDPWWNPAVEDQATDRAHRIGQTRPVTVYRLVAQGTIEEEILRLHADKRDLVAGLLEGADSAGKMSTEELISLIRGDNTVAHDPDPEPEPGTVEEPEDALPE
ncbi:MAG: DEAD/DEAH box helicase, partial [Planctomycetia bacterium]